MVYAQEIKKWIPLGHVAQPVAGGTSVWQYEARAQRSARQAGALRDERNLVPMAFHCHGAHHSGQRRLELSLLPDGVFEFAADLMGPSAAFVYLRRMYAGEDPRLDALSA